MKTFSMCLVAAGLLAGVTTRAQGATLATPFVLANGTDFLVCAATNIGNRDATVTVQFKDSTGMAVAPAGAGCGTTLLTLAAGTSCYNTYPVNVDGSCIVAAKGKVRAALEILDGPGNVKTVIPATK